MVFGGGFQDSFQLADPIVELGLVLPEFVRLFVDGRLLLLQLVDLLALGLDLFQRVLRGLFGGDQLVLRGGDFFEIASCSLLRAPRAGRSTFLVSAVQGRLGVLEALLGDFDILLDGLQLLLELFDLLLLGSGRGLPVSRRREGDRRDSEKEQRDGRDHDDEDFADEGRHDLILNCEYRRIPQRDWRHMRLDEAVAPDCPASATAPGTAASPETFVLKLYFENSTIMSRQPRRIAASAIPSMAT